MKMWLSRDKDGELHLNYDKPEKHGNVWINQLSDFMELYSEDYPEVTFENSPMEVELKLIETLKKTWKKYVNTAVRSHKRCKWNGAYQMVINS